MSTPEIQLLPADSPEALDAARLCLACTLGYGERRHTVWRWREGHPALAAWFDGFAARPRCSPPRRTTVMPASSRGHGNRMWFA